MLSKTQILFILVSMVYIDALSTNNSTLSNDILDPDDIVDQNDIRKTEYQYLPLYIIGVGYMFIGIAILCDEFFVPSLELIGDRLHLGPDVAGATLMAAGGSAPELFTSFIGTFRKNDLGFSTIVGSAVFNVLFVIAACVIFAPKPLKLTWWPLFRDMTFYTFGLIAISIFFIGISPNEIEWWEALILFSLYGLYVYLMKYNEQLYEYFTGEKLPIEPDEPPISWRAGVWREGIINFLNMDKKWVISTVLVSKVAGNVEATFKSIDTDSNGKIDKTEFTQAVSQLGHPLKTEEIDELFNEIDLDGNGYIEEEEFKPWYLASENRIKAEIDKLFENVVDNQSLQNLLTKLNLEIDTETVYKEMGLTEGEISSEAFQDWYEKSIFWKDHVEKNQLDAELSQGISLQPPKQGICNKLRWCLTIPLMVLFSYTIPDVNQPKYTKWMKISFLMSIVWIGILSYFMVDWGEIVGNTIGIPINVMGLTVLAAGTSVPDLLSSIVVTKQGKGDMAVSSSIGSNIFDILVGLPFPWLIFSLVNNLDPVKVGASNLPISLIVLILMLVCVLVSIKLCQWEMNKKLGYTMFFLYLVFVAQDLARSDW